MGGGDAQDTTWPVIDLRGVTELRVHGVGGTPATDILDDPTPVQVSGDRVAGVMWSRPGAGEGLVRWRLEAYSWGGLTGRSAVRAFWLLLLPFSLVNLIGWMAPVRTGRGTGLRRGLVRLLSLCLTGLYVMFAAEVGMDFLGAQCTSDPDCALNGWWPPGGTLTRAVVWGAVIPLLVVALLWGLGRRSRRQYELWSRTGAPPDGRADDEVRRGLAQPGFWSGQAYAERLAGVHVGFSFALVALLLGTTTTSAARGPAGPVLVGVCAVFLVFAALLSLISRLRDRVTAAAVEAAGAVLLAGAVVVAWTAPAEGPPPLILPGLIDVFDALIDVIILAGLAILVVDAVLIRLHRPDLRGLDRLLSLVGPLCAVAFAALLTGAFLSGVTMFIADFFGDLRSAADGPVPRGPDGMTVLAYPQPFEAFARAFLLLPAVLISGAVVGALFTLATRGPVVRKATAERAEAWKEVTQPGADAFPGPPPGRMDGSFWWPLTGLGVAVGAAVAVTLVTMSFALPYCGARMVARLNGSEATDGWGDLDSVTWGLIPLRLGIALLTFLPVVLVFVLRRGLTEASTRRSIAVFWDVLTFWPRAFHPLAPPSYAERAVPEIQVRLRRLWAQEGRCVLLGHSQGSVLAAAAIAALPESELPSGRLALITYGSPLTRLYTRFFPAYFDAAFFTGLGRRLTVGQTLGWVNLYRDTDPVGRRLAAPADTLTNVYLPDPATPWRFEGDGRPPVRRHGHDGYRSQRIFRRELLIQVQRLTPAVITLPDHDHSPQPDPDLRRHDEPG